MNCDIVSPSWIRLFANSGSNLLISIPGVYLSGRSAYVVIKHLKYFKSSEASNRSRGPVSTNASYGSKEPILENQVQIQIEHPPIRHLDPSYKRRSDDLLSVVDIYKQITNLDPSYQRSDEDFSNNSNIIEKNNPVHKIQGTLLAPPPRSHTPRLLVNMALSSTGHTEVNHHYEMTKAAAIRIVLFASLFALINLFASTGAVMNILKGHPIPTGVTITDWVGGSQGILIFLIFGLPNS
ncbi:16736_t:CDS:2 [Cetraspora pellucida]|uniref:16736_t:CDS:1 n=1 Tax=Cetraspora pellucida TaxID=1433469 RepID=A0A9N8ZML1_9GLOM|nr:16736_t:CDS:2 [Cetraspora pellucida]